MPELPEVEIARRALARWGVDRRIVAVRAPDPGAIRTHLSSRPSDALPDGEAVLRRALVGATAGEPRRHGKRLGWPFRDPGAALLVHLGMSGRWALRDRDTHPRHGRLALDLDDGGTLWFVDPRRFGAVVPVDPDRLSTALAQGLGPDALVHPPGPDGLRERLAGRRAIKVALLDQARLAGVGNIHAVEALWRARLHPATPADALDPPAWERLARAVPEQLAWAIAEEADQEIAYVTEGGDNPFVVYGREGEACPRCGGAVARSVQSGRATFWCPGCQPAPSRDNGRGRSSR